MATLLCALMVVSATSPSLGGLIEDAPRYDLMSNELIEALNAVDAGGFEEELEVIFQYNRPLEEGDLQEISRLGLNVLGRTEVINGGLVAGSANEILQFSKVNDLFHLELNLLLEHFYLPGEEATPLGSTDIDAVDSPLRDVDGGESETSMEETIHVVNASSAWHRAIIDVDGDLQFEDDNSFSEWDGDGTTAVDLDTGIDGEHPDFDCGEPWSGEKLIWSAKWSGVAWVDAPNCNSDTSSGHGTHVGGTIAGNGDASAGRRLGTAKGAQIVALGTGDGASIFAAVEGLEWVYENSRPGLNQYNIRVVSNSWGTNGDYDPDNAVSVLTAKLTYDHGVAVIFAASNSGGSGAEGDGDLRTNVYANTPSAISVAALTHDGSAVTSFSSRGWMSQQHTWPDIAAPGRDIWATAPRATAIDASTRTQGDLYYMAISGTSMATPHIGGIATLLISVAPSLKVADYQHDDHDEGSSMVTKEAAQGFQDEMWASANHTRVHEVELILELTAKYDPLRNSCEDGNDEDDCVDIPETCYISNTTNRCHDWRVGHGLVHVDEAVALAATTQTMRDPDGDGFLDNPEVTVWDAYAHYLGIMDVREIPLETDQLKHSWKGEWSHFNNGPTSTFGSYATDDRHYVWVPAGTQTMQIAFSSLDWDSESARIASIRPNVDLGSDGNDDAQGEGQKTGDTLYITLEVDEDYWETWTEFDVTGTAISLPITEVLSGSEFLEPRVPYTVDVLLTLDLSEKRVVDWQLRQDGYTDLDPAPPSESYDASMQGDLIYVRPVYDLSAVPEWKAENGFLTTSGASWFWVLAELLAFAALGGIAYAYARRVIGADGEVTLLLEKDTSVDVESLEADLVE